MDRRVGLLVVIVAAVAREIDSRNETAHLKELVGADAQLVERTAVVAFTDMLAEATLLVVSLAFVVFFAYSLPKIADFFFALCKVPRHIRYQLTLAIRVLIVVVGVYYAFVLVGVDLTTVVVVASVASIIVADTLRPLTTALVAGFWLQSSPDYEPGRRIRANGYYGTIIQLDTFGVVLRLMPDAKDDGDALTSTRRTSSEEPDAGVDLYGKTYADRTVRIPNADLLTEPVMVYHNVPQTRLADRRYAQPTAAWSNNRAGFR